MSGPIRILYVSVWFDGGASVKYSRGVGPGPLLSVSRQRALRIIQALMVRALPVHTPKSPGASRTARS